MAGPELSEIVLQSADEVPAAAIRPEVTVRNVPFPLEGSHHLLLFPTVRSPPAEKYLEGGRHE